MANFDNLMGLRLQPFEEAKAAAADPEDVDRELKKSKFLEFYVKSKCGYFPHCAYFRAALV